MLARESLLLRKQPLDELCVLHDRPHPLTPAGLWVGRQFELPPDSGIERESLLKIGYRGRLVVEFIVQYAERHPRGRSRHIPDDGSRGIARLPRLPGGSQLARPLLVQPALVDIQQPPQFWKRRRVVIHVDVNRTVVIDIPPAAL